MSLALERAARFERAIASEVRGPVSQSEIRAVEAAMGRFEHVPSRRTWRWTILAAAGVALTTFTLWRTLSRESAAVAEQRVVLGQGRQFRVEPEGEVEEFTALRWHTPTRGSARFDVRVYDEATGQLLLESTDLPARELALDQRETDAWRQVRIEVDELDSGGDPTRSVQARAWRRSR